MIWFFARDRHDLLEGRVARQLDVLSVLRPAAPGLRFIIGEGCPGKEVAAKLVADVPGIEGRYPFFHLRFGNSGWAIYEGGEDACVVDACVPEVKGKVVIEAEFSRQSSNPGH